MSIVFGFYLKEHTNIITKISMSNNPCRKVIISKNGKAKRLKHDTHELLFITYVAIKIVVKFQAEEFFQVVLRVVELLHKYAW